MIFNVGYLLIWNGLEQNCSVIEMGGGGGGGGGGKIENETQHR